MSTNPTGAVLVYWRYHSVCCEMHDNLEDAVADAHYIGDRGDGAPSAVIDYADGRPKVFEGVEFDRLLSAWRERQREAEAVASAQFNAENPDRWRVTVSFPVVDGRTSTSETYLTEARAREAAARFGGWAIVEQVQ